MEKISGIYKITNIIDNKCYIGQSVNIYKRWKDHETRSQKENTPLYLAIRKYGLENFTFEIIEKVNKEGLNEREKYWIKYYNSYNNGYNQTIGGDGAIKEETETVKNIKQDLLNTLDTHKIIAERNQVSEEMVQGINTGRYWYSEENQYPIRESRFNPIKGKQIFYCKDCGKEISKNSIRCKECESKNRIQEKPITREELKKKIRAMSFVQIGKEFHCSDNNVRKWCDFYNLPRTKKDIKSYSDEEWEKI